MRLSVLASVGGLVATVLCAAPGTDAQSVPLFIPTQIRTFTPPQIGGLSIAQVRSLSISEIHSLSIYQSTGFTARQLEAFSAAQLAALPSIPQDYRIGVVLQELGHLYDLPIALKLEAVTSP